MLDDKVNTLIKSEKENNQLNDSVFSLLEAVSTLSERDLTINVPVHQDITGSLADAINLMVDEIIEVLQGVNLTANKVDRSSNIVSKKATEINSSINSQKDLTLQTSQTLKNTSMQLNEIASLAQSCNNIADNTIDATTNATKTVSSTIDSMNEIRDSIQETAKKIKGLGERSQEISSIVDIINTLSERTHVLALNASMQAAAAGEAGRGFAVVAEEVQRLAQSSRDATGQISSLVKNIQFDTSETISNMDETISSVVKGSNFAKDAGKQMENNNKSTQLLVKSVNKIADYSNNQAKIGISLVQEADKMIETSLVTSSGMKQQVVQTKELLANSIKLIKLVRAFKLPENKK
jgi:methyl-accepting chemotaxis protein